MKVISIRIPELPIPAINCSLTFRPYLKYLESQIAATSSPTYRDFLAAIAHKITSNPELLEPIHDFSVLERHQDVIELIKITHLSHAKGDQKMLALGIPSGSPTSMNYFGYTEEFARFQKQMAGNLKMGSPQVGEEFRRDVYREVLHRGYNVSFDNATDQPMLQWAYDAGNVRKYFKVTRRLQFVDLIPQPDAPEARQEWIDFASGGIASESQLSEPFPFHKFGIEGFFIFSIEEETEAVALAELGKAVSRLHAGSDHTIYDQVRKATLSLLGEESLKVGFLAMLKVNGDFVYHNFYAVSSLVFGRLKNHFAEKELAEIYHCIAEHSSSNATVLDSLDNDIYCIEDDNEAVEHVRKVLVSNGLVAMKFVPVWHNNVLLGIIELGSSHEKKITTGLLRKLDAALPIFRELFLFKANSFDNHLRSFIMQRYTSIQKSVAWKFNQEIWNAHKNVNDPAQEIETPPIRFENMHPFYGAVDFRNSSQKQLEAIHSDYKAQLRHLEDLIEKYDLANDDRESANFLREVRTWIHHLSSDMNIQEEASLRRFLESESIHFIDHLAERKKIKTSDATDYTLTVTSKYGKFHMYHNQYEESLQELNRVLREELMREEETLQERLPHYFEKFQTDGVEYSIYAGKNINPSYPFNDESLISIAEWQIDTMLKMAKAADDYKKYLAVPLETTQLILINENTVDISYRIDERHFDVEGSYSIRYQVLKKRIDKVRIRDTNERLTQPSTVSIVYANPEAIKAYLHHIDRLIKSRKLASEIEHLDLEKLQGIGMMKAIRVKINLDNRESVEQIASELNIH